MRKHKKRKNWATHDVVVKEGDLMKLLCAIGLHKLVRKDTWTPNMYAPIVTQFKQTHTCSCCGKVITHVHLQWNGIEMVDVDKEKI